MPTIDIFHYDSQCVLRGKDTIELLPGLGLPAMSTDVPPPDDILESPFVCQFNRKTRAWHVTEDHRGTAGYVGDKEVIVDTVGPLADVTDAMWVAGPYVEPLETAFEAMTEKLASVRKEMEYRGPLVEIDGSKFYLPCEVKDEIRMASVQAAFDANPGLVIEDWKIGKNVYMTLNAQLVKSLKDAAFLHIGYVFQVERAKYMQLEAIMADKETSESDKRAALAYFEKEQLNTGWDYSEPAQNTPQES